jgi:sugar lactone lactonase YvrE
VRFSDYTEGLVLRVFQADGSPVGDAVETGMVAYRRPGLAALPDGRFVVAGGELDNPQDNVVARVYEADGTESGVKFVVQGEVYPDGVAVAPMADGSLLVLWVRPNWDAALMGIHGQVFGADGEPATAELKISSAAQGEFGSLALAALADGTVAAVWHACEYDGTDDCGVFVQRLDAGGKKLYR